ncbi:MAG: type II toxin-antitoxin system HicB family antitoxin [Acidobacteriota bacterium]
MKTYIFKVFVEPDEDRWHAYCPALLQQGAATWGRTAGEALKHIHEVVQVVMEELAEDGEPIPEDVQVSEEPLVSVMVSSSVPSSAVTSVIATRTAEESR